MVVTTGRSSRASRGRLPQGWVRLLHVVRKEFLELRQDPRLFGLVIIAPIMQLVMLGYAASTDVRNVPMVVVDQDRSTESRTSQDHRVRGSRCHDCPELRDQP